jgi:hypothetical protein
MVKVIEIDSQGRINLSRKAVLGGGDGAPQDRGEDENAVPAAPRSNGRIEGSGGGGERRPRRRRPSGGSAE